ncbi:MAG TPA: thiol peroxidase [Nitrospiraceae bacterium]|nr:thiol peroxidase [Nitrospiraceae bacterium]
MHPRNFVSIPAMPAILLLIAAAGCSTTELMGPDFSYKTLPVADGSAKPGDGNNVLFQGKPLMLSGTAIKVGEPLRDVKLVQTDLSLTGVTDTKGKGKVRIISVVPSLDTKVCEQQTHYLSEKNKGLDKMVELITISVDTPFAQKRFSEEAKIRNVTFLSDYRGVDFGKAHGLFLKDPHLLTRAVLVVDKDNVVRYLQVTPELAQLPDMEEAFRFARKLVTAS